MAKNIGIDLGTTNSCISYLEGKEAMIVPNPEGARVIPTMVALNVEGKRIFGNVAKRQFVTNSKNTIWGIKRLMGRKYDSPETAKIRSRTGYAVVPAENGDAKVVLGERVFSPEEISGIYLTYLKEVAENFLGEAVGEVVITVPAFFNDAQRQATKVAGEIAGLNVSRIINEPTAAMLAYGGRIDHDGLYAVYDLGGGTFDISIVEVTGDIYKVVSSLGDTFLGGSDFDARVSSWIFQESEREVGADLRSNKDILQRVLQVAEKAKIELSFNSETLVSIPYLYHFPGGTTYHFQKKLTRTQLEGFTSDLVDRSLELIRQAMSEINITPDQVERVIMVGGQSRMPLVYERLTKLFGKAPDVDINPEEVVAQGAAIQAEVLRGRVRDLLLLDVTPLSLGLETKNNTFTRIIERNSTIPTKKSMVFTTIADNQHTVRIHVLQGEREVAAENKSLGNFDLVGIPLAPKGIPQIEVSFEIDANGIVKVSAVDKQTNLSQSMKVQPASGLSPEEIERIIQEGKDFQDKDRLTVQLTQLKAQLKDEFETVRFYYQRFVDKLAPSDRGEVDKLVATTPTLLEGEDPVGLEEQLEKVRAVRGKINAILMSEFEKMGKQ